ncbi:MAG TPA: hypothetical protein VFW27_33215 [Actinoplanes sp.]|nr:hypothetical protein [Actinoplanes sp.]
MQWPDGGDQAQSWLAQAGALLGVGGLGAILLKVVERVFARADRADDIAAGLRGEMVRRIETLERQYTELEKRERETFRRAVRLESENVQLRRRWHDLMNWMQAQPGLPTPPQWLYERIQGPTEGQAQPASPEGEAPS